MSVKSSEGEDLQLFSPEYLESLTPKGELSLVPSGSDKALEPLQLDEDDEEEEKEERFS